MVVVIISILSTLGFVQYSKIIERQHGRNALAYLRAIRGAEISNYIDNKEFTNNIDDLDLSSGVFDADNDFDISISTSSDSFTITAERKGNTFLGYLGKKIVLTVTVSDQGITTDIETDTDDVYKNL